MDHIYSKIARHSEEFSEETLEPECVLGDHEKSAFVPDSHSLKVRFTHCWAENRFFLVTYTLAIQTLGFILGCVVTFLVIQLKTTKPLLEMGTFEAGFATEFASPSKTIELVRVRFTSGLDFDSDGALYRIWDSDGVDYVGSPSPEVDAAWGELIRDMFIAVTDAEAASLEGELWIDPRDGFGRAGVSVLHTLHCVNVVRRALHPDYYPTMKFHSEKLHVDHCIDHIRQYVQCHGDLTPLPERWSASARRPNADFRVEHTCRNFKRLQKWATDRNHDVISHF